MISICCSLKPLESGLYGKELGDQLIDIDDTAPIPGIEWEFIVDRAQAAMLGANMAEIGTAIQLMTNGIFMGDYRPDDSEEEVDIGALSL